MNGHRGTQLVELVCLYEGEGGGIRGPNNKPMKAGSGHPTVLLVEELYPGVQLLEVLQVVENVSGWGIIPFKPYKFGGLRTVTMVARS